MDEKRLILIKEGIRELDPKLESDDPAFAIAVILMAAAFVTGPDSDRLVSFTGYPPGVVADVSRRMHEAGLWERDTVKTDHWFDGDKLTVGFWADTLVAEGVVATRLDQDETNEVTPSEWVSRSM